MLPLSKLFSVSYLDVEFFQVFLFELLLSYYSYNFSSLDGPTIKYVLELPSLL